MTDFNIGPEQEEQLMKNVQELEEQLQPRNAKSREGTANNGRD